LPRDPLIARVVIAANKYPRQRTVLVRLCYFSSILRKGFLAPVIGATTTALLLKLAASPKRQGGAGGAAAS